MARKLLVGGLAIAALLVLYATLIPVLTPVPSLADIDKGIPPATAKTARATGYEAPTAAKVVTKLDKVTPEMIAPYFEAAFIRSPNLNLRACDSGNNFDKLPNHGVRRDPFLETTAAKMAGLFKNNTWGDRWSKYIPLSELDPYLAKFEEGDSPWGLFNDPRLHPMTAYYLKVAKELARAEKKNG